MKAPTPYVASRKNGSQGCWPRAAALAAGLVAAVISWPGSAGDADVIAVKAVPGPGGTYHFSVTVRHADDGWDHYADRWEVLTPAGTVLATRVLLHPHVSEQPFTRSLAGIEVPESLTQVVVRARDSVHGYGGAETTVDLPDR